MAIKKKRQQSPKEKKLAFIAFPFAIAGTICGILAATGMGFLVWLILAFIFLGIVIVLVLMMMKEHKKWVEEGNKEYRYYDTETGQEVDECGNPIDPNEVKEPTSQPELEQSGGETPQEKPVNAPTPQPAPKKQPETIRGADLTIFGKLLPAVGIGLLSLAFLLRTIMFIRELVDYAKYGDYWGSYVLYALRILGPAILLIIAVIALVKFFKDKQTINKGYKAFINLAIWYAVLNIVGIIYTAACAVFLALDIIDIVINNSENIEIIIYILFDNCIIYFFYLLFAIALIIFSKIATRNSVDSIKNKVFAAIPFGIIVIIEIMFMIVTGATLPEGYIAPGYYVTAVITLLGASAIAAIPFLVRFEKENASGVAEAAPAVVPVAPAPVYKEPDEPKDLEEPKEEKPNNKNNGDPEVKSNKKGLIIILVIVLALVLVGGGVTAAILLANKNNREKGPDDNTSSQVIPTSKSSSSSSSSESSSNSSSSYSSSSKSSSSSSSSSSSESYNAWYVINGVCGQIFGEAKYKGWYPEDYNYWQSGEYYISLVSFEDPSLANDSYLAYGVEIIRDYYLPSYLTPIDSLYMSTWTDGANGAFQHFTTPDEKVWLELGTFVYHDDSGDTLLCQVSVADL